MASRKPSRGGINNENNENRRQRPLGAARIAPPRRIDHRAARFLSISRASQHINGMAMAWRIGKISFMGDGARRRVAISERGSWHPLLHISAHLLFLRAAIAQVECACRKHQASMARAWRRACCVGMGGKHSMAPKRRPTPSWNGAMGGCAVVALPACMAAGLLTMGQVSSGVASPFCSLNAPSISLSSKLAHFLWIFGGRLCLFYLLLPALLLHTAHTFLFSRCPLHTARRRGGARR